MGKEPLVVRLSLRPNSWHKLIISSKLLYIKGSPIVEGMISLKGVPAASLITFLIVSIDSILGFIPLAFFSSLTLLYGEKHSHIIQAKLQ